MPRLRLNVALDHAANEVERKTMSLKKIIVHVFLFLAFLPMGNTVFSKGLSDLSSIYDKREHVLEANLQGRKKEIKLELSLNDVIRRVALESPDVISARLEWKIKERKARAAWGDFEPNFFATGGFSRQKKQVENQTGGITFNNDDSNPEVETYTTGIQGKFFTGAEYKFGYSLRRNEENEKGKADPSRSHQGSVSVEIDQPLLRGAWFGVPIQNVQSNENSSIAAFHQYRNALARKVAKAESVYWELVFSQELYAVDLTSLRTAEELVRDVQARVHVGKMSKSGLSEAQSLLADERTNLAETEGLLAKAKEELKLLLSDEEISNVVEIKATGKLESPLELSEKSSFSTLSHDEEDLVTMEATGEKETSSDVLIDEILAYHPLYLTHSQALEMAYLLLNYQKDTLLPELSLIGSYGRTATSDDGFSDFLDGMVYNENTWYCGVRLTIPLFGGISERNEVQAAKLLKEKAEETLRAYRYIIKSELKKLRDDVNRLWKRIGNTKNIVRHKRHLLKVALARVKIGQNIEVGVTADDQNNVYKRVYVAEKSLASARRQELEEILLYNQALIDVALTGGTVLTKNNIEKIVNGEIFLSSWIQ